MDGLGQMNNKNNEFENISELVKRIIKLQKKIKIYANKLMTMGLDEEEKIKYYSILEECIRCKFLANDIIFDKNILNESLIPKKIQEQYSELKTMVSWDGKTIFDPDEIQLKKEMWESFTAYRRKKVKKMMQETFSVLVEFIISQSLQNKYPNIEYVANVLSDGQDISLDSILTFLSCRFELLESSFNGGVKIDEKIIKDVQSRIISRRTKFD